LFFFWGGGGGGGVGDHLYIYEFLDSSQP
jgi:hypothetical protein